MLPRWLAWRVDCALLDPLSALDPPVFAPDEGRVEGEGRDAPLPPEGRVEGAGREAPPPEGRVEGDAPRSNPRAWSRETRDDPDPPPNCFAVLLSR